MTATDVRDTAREAPADSWRLGFVQGIRGIAVLVIVIYHAGVTALPAGFVAVDYFFVISGFVITRLLVREIRTEGRIDFRTFYRRRVRRLLPVLVLTTSVTIAFSAVLQSPVYSQSETAFVGIGASVWAANMAIWVVTAGYFGATPSTIPLLHTWSLSVEEQFYLLFPALIAVGAWLGRTLWRKRTTGIAVVLAAITVVSFLLGLILTYALPNIQSAQGLAYLAAPTRAWGFGVGALVAIRAARRPPLGRRAAGVAGTVGMFLMVGSIWWLPTPLPWPGYGALAPIVGTALVIEACRVEGTWPKRVYEMAWIKRIGDVSYSWYLWHWPCVTFAGLLTGERLAPRLAAGFAAYPLAVLTYKTVEDPFRKKQPGKRPHTFRFIAVAMGIPIVLAITLLLGASGSWGQKEIEDYADQIERANETVPLSCMGQVFVTDRDLDECTVAGSSDEPPIILVGDSNAWQYADAVVGAGQELDRTVIVTTVGGCPLADVQVHQRGASWRGCLDFREDLMGWLAGQPDATLVVVSANRFIQDDHFDLSDPATGDRSGDVDGKAEIWATGLERSFEALEREGHTILQVNMMPHLYRSLDEHIPWDPRQCSFPKLLRDTTDCGTSTPRSEVDAYQGVALATEREVAEDMGIAQLDLRDRICPGEVCSTNDGTFRTYIDGLHISVAMAQRLTPDFTEALRETG